MTFADRLKELRTERNMSLNDIAVILDIQRATVYKYEHGLITNIPPDKVHKLAKLFGVSRPYMMGWSDERGLNPEKNIDIVAEKMSVPVGEMFDENDTMYWRATSQKDADYITAATQAARALIKFKVSRTPIYPQQILQASQYATMISFAYPGELDKIIENTNVITSQKHGNLVMSSLYVTEDDLKSRYLFSVNRNAPMGHLKLALAIELGHIYMGHNSHFKNSDRKSKEAECFAIHLEFPRALIKLLMERGYILTKETFSRIFGDCEWCLESILNAPPVHIVPELNRMVKEQFAPYVDALDYIGINTIPSEGNPLDLSQYMEGYEE